MKNFYPIFLFVFSFFAAQYCKAQVTVIDNFDNSDNWKIIASEGVKLEISAAKGIKGNAVRIDYDFTKGTGYGGIQKVFPFKLPPNYKFSFYVKGNSPNNNLEFKLIDKSGENVWWMNNRDFEFPENWEKTNIKKKHILFAWGPTENTELAGFDKVEFMIASFNGGKGTVYIDELQIEEQPATIADLGGTTISILVNNNNPHLLNDGNINTIWYGEGKESEEILIDLKGHREIGGLKIDWDKKNFPGYCCVLASANGYDWDSVYQFKKETNFTNYIMLKELEAGFIKLCFRNDKEKKLNIGIAEIKILPSDYSSGYNKFFINNAKDFPRGYFPRYLNEEASFWSVIGVNNDTKEAMINEEGMIEVDKASFSIEPFLFTDGKFITWNDAEIKQSLVDNYLPIPQVKWDAGGLKLEITAFAEGEANSSSVLYISYKIINTSGSLKEGSLYLALRPFQVNPYYQELNLTGGVSRISEIAFNKDYVTVNGQKTITPLDLYDGFGASTFDNGDIINFISQNNLPVKPAAKDKFKFASAAYKYNFVLKKGEEKIVSVAIPFHQNISGQNFTKENLLKKYDATVKFWKNKLNRVKYNLPPSADKIINTVRSNLAYILINRDKAGIQPGSRSYERSWIRDGALTSSALLKNGIVTEVKEFIEWYSKHQFENGKVPCVVDTRGPDPVPENDSHGEFIYLIKQYFNFTKDTLLLKKYYPNVIKAVEYIDYLTGLRKTEHFKEGNDSVKSLYGLLPESISHEGYSAKPMHSYWDDFWAMKGLKDAVEIAAILGDDSIKAKFENLRYVFRTNLYNSINLSVKYKNINYLPGCAELGDFDATSTTIALYPCNELKNLPPVLLKNTFDKYYEYFSLRKNDEAEWTNYTPYEVRTIGSFIFLDEIEKAHDEIDFFLEDQFPKGWNHWAEVVWKNERTPKYIGDMPHTWVGSDFINAMRTLFVYENEYDNELIIGAGLYKDWIDSPGGISVENLPTYYGELSYSIKHNDDYYEFFLYGNLKLPEGGAVLKNFNGKKPPSSVIINNETVSNFTNDKIIIHEFPANIKIFY